VGAGVKEVTGLRGTTSKRGIAVVNACTPNMGLGGMPVGILLEPLDPLPPLEPLPPLA
jgi:hypothetical protein